MTYYWQVTVQFERENDNGRIQKIKENYLVDAMTGTEAEAKTYKKLEEMGEVKDDFKVTALKQSNILRVF
jgi:hypothetical protein